MLRGSRHKETKMETTDSKFTFHSQDDFEAGKAVVLSSGLDFDIEVGDGGRMEIEVLDVPEVKAAELRDAVTSAAACDVDE